MVDVTAKIIWYKLGETYKNMNTKAERFSEWYEDFSWRRVDILDMIFLGWLLAAFLVVAAINIYLRFFGLPKYKKWARDGGFITRDEGINGAVIQGGESCQWLNSALSWLFLHYNHTPEFVETWLRALNDQAKKHSDQLQVKFERVQAGSLPPKLSQLTTDVSSRETLTVRATIESSELTLLVSAIQQSATSLKVANCDVSVQKLLGQLRVHSNYASEEIITAVSFTSPPELKLLVKPRSYEAKVDTAVVESIVRDAIIGAVTNIVLPSQGGFPTFYATSRFDAAAPGLQHAQRSPMSWQPPPLRTSAASVEKTSPDFSASPSASPSTVSSVSPATNSTVSYTSCSISSMSNGQARSLQGKRLLVKVIKANGLGNKEFGCTDAYCIAHMDAPPQNHTTSIVKNTVNPFWDEHFLFDLEDNSRQIVFEVYDGSKPPDDFLGRANIPMTELRRMPSSRQIIPLTAKPGSTTSTSGSITVEFLFMDSAESQGMSLNLGAGAGSQDANVSPRRRIETMRTVTPGGTTITTTTTTTHKPKDHYNDPAYNESPSRIEKSESSSLFPSGDHSPYSSRGSHLSAHDAALTASQGGSLPRGSPRLMVTQASTGRLAHTTDHGSPEEHLVGHDNQSLSTTASDARDHKKKSLTSAIKKRFARSKKPRSQSADRTRSSSYKESSLLKPPEPVDTGAKTTEDLDGVEFPDGSLRKSRSHSFSSSLKRLFKKKSKGGPASRESSVSRASNRGETSREGSMTQPSPVISGNRTTNMHHHQQQPSPDYTPDYPYSSSVPARTSPLYNH